MSSGFAGLLDEPFLETRLSGDRFQRHYIERGGAGRRYFNVSGFMLAARRGERRLSLAGVRMEVREPGTTARVARRRASRRRPLLVLAPHPGAMAEIGRIRSAQHAAFLGRHRDAGGCGSEPLRRLSERQVGVLCREGPHAGLGQREHSAVGEPPPVFTANRLFDGTLTRMRESPDQPVKPLYHEQADISRLRVNPLDKGQPPRDATWRNLVADMRKLLVEVAPTAVALPHPVLDPHGDHRCTTLALLEALSELPPMPGNLLLYANHLSMTELYPVGPCEGAVSIPPMFDESVTIRTVWSLPLDAHTRVRKRVALETHHDLRPLQYQDGRTLLGVIKDALLRPYTYLVQPDIDYVRRAVRPNELFFVMDFAEAGELRRVVLKSAAGAASSAP